MELHSDKWIICAGNLEVFFKEVSPAPYTATIVLRSLAIYKLFRRFRVWFRVSGSGLLGFGFREQFFDK